jgi:hypothetical protein
MAKKHKQNSNETRYDDREAARRFEAALRGAFSTPATPMRDLPRKRPRAERKQPLKPTESA